jgi:hypothetical protein
VKVNTILEKATPSFEPLALEAIAFAKGRNCSHISMGAISYTNFSFVVGCAVFGWWTSRWCSGSCEGRVFAIFVLVRVDNTIALTEIYACTLAFGCEKCTLCTNAASQLGDHLMILLLGVRLASKPRRKSRKPTFVAHFHEKNLTDHSAYEKHHLQITACGLHLFVTLLVQSDC